MLLRPYQKEASDAAVMCFQRGMWNGLLVLPTACHAKGTKILMYDGTMKCVEDIRVGEKLMGPDSTPRNVLELHHGVDNMFKIQPKIGNAFVVNGSHILSLYKTKEGDRLNELPRVDEISVNDFLKTNKTYKHTHKLRRPSVIDFGKVDGAVGEPYLLGLYLGDGSSAGGGFNITTMRKEVEDYLRNFCEHYGYNLRVSQKPGNKAKTFSISSNGTKSNPNQVLEWLKDLGVYKLTAGYKHIPHQYKTASVKDRYDLLAGLLDTDAWYDINHCCFEYCTKSLTLALDIQFLCRSLGFMCNIGKTKVVNGVNYYRMQISGNLDKIPTKVAIRQARPRKMKKNVLVTGFDINPAGRGEYYGFALDGDHLYIDNQFFIHHNSGKSFIIADIAKRLDAPLLVFQPTREITLQNYEKVKRTGMNDVGIYSASLGMKNIRRITLATIGSVHNHMDDFRLFKYVIVDECFTGETEILTDKGFVRFDCLTRENMVAQYNDGVISFVSPINYTRRLHNGIIVYFHVKDGVDVPMTPGHNQLFYTKKYGYRLEKISEAKFSYSKFLPVSGLSDINDEGLTDMERMYIATQVDGSIHKIYDDYVTISFSFSKERKINRLLYLCKKIGLYCKEVKDRDNKRRFMVRMPPNTTKDITKHIHFPMSAHKAVEIIEECSMWDGSVLRPTLRYYSSVDKSQVDFYNSVATLGGYSCYTSVQKDDRKESYRDVYRLFMRKNFKHRNTQNMTKKTGLYSGVVYCVEVPSHCIVVRHGGYTFISGNCHRVNPECGMYKDYLTSRADRCIIGLTATPYRISSFMGCVKTTFLTRLQPRIYDKVLYVCQVSDMMEKGYLCKPQYFDVNGKIAFQLKNVKVNATGLDYDEQSLEKEYERSNFARDLLAWTLMVLKPNDGSERNGVIVFTRFVKESERLMAGLRSRGVSVETVTSKTKKEERKRIVNDFKNGRIKVIANAGVFLEGFDYPALDTIIVASPTRSLMRWSQMIGRVLRPYDGKRAWVVDMTGNYRQFGKVEDMRIENLSGVNQWVVTSNGRQLTGIIN